MPTIPVLIKWQIQSHFIRPTPCNKHTNLRTYSRSFRSNAACLLHETKPHACTCTCVYTTHLWFVCSSGCAEE